MLRPRGAPGDPGACLDLAGLVEPAAVMRTGAHFLALGALLFAAVHLLRAPAASPDLDAETVLYEAARARGLARTDPVVRRRLLRNMRFLAPGDPRDDTVLLDEAYALGLDRGDLVVRRRLVQRMQLEAFTRADAREPDERELRAAFDRAAEHWRRPPRVRLTHVFFSRDRRGSALADASALAVQLDGVVPAEAPLLGDPFLLGSHTPLLSEAELATRFGPELARAVLAGPVGRWSAPLRSSYGLHRVWVHERDPGGPSAFEAVRGRVREELRGERRREALRSLVAELRG